MDKQRRDFIKGAGALGAGAALTGSSPMKISAQSKFEEKAGAIATHKLPELRYNYNALEPIIDAKTLKLHHTKHHASYVKGLNQAEEELALARTKNDFSVIQHWEKRLAFNGAGHFLHNLYWKSMSPDGGGKPKGIMAEMLNKDFGSFDFFKNQFSAVAASVQGSGWALLCHRITDKKLIILQVENHEKYTTWDLMPIMALDVWEHAYYLKYQNKRADYINEWWNLVDWENISQGIEMHK